MNPVRPWTTFAVMLGTALLLAPAISFSQANRLIINRGSQPQATVTLQQDSNVNIDPVTGNVIVDCAPNPGDPSRCNDALGGGTLPPNFTLAASNFSRPETAGQYPALTTFILSPVGLSASYEACRRISTGGAGATNWDGYVSAVSAQGSATLPNPASTYNFSLRCFADGGARTSNIVTLLTADGPAPPPGCPLNWNGQAWEGFSRNSSQVRFTDIRSQVSGNITDFPQFSAGAIGATGRQYLSLEFTAIPKTDVNQDGFINLSDFGSLQKLLTWIEAQGGGQGSANVNQVYVTISKCSGDLRLPAANNQPDPTESTLNLGCRNIGLNSGTRVIQAGIQYSINDAPNNATCALAYAQTYYLNFVTVNPLDGYAPNPVSGGTAPVTEHNCLDTVFPRCGVAMLAQ